MLWLLAQVLGTVVAALAVAMLAIRLLNPLPPLEPRAASHHFADTENTPLGRAIDGIREGHDGESGIHMLVDGYDAFAARVLLGPCGHPGQRL